MVTFKGAPVDVRALNGFFEAPWLFKRNGTYHTADAKDGGHFRRSVAIDRLEWDDGVRPAQIRRVIPTGGAPFDATPISNIASHARVTASNVPVPVRYWLRAINDGKVRAAPLPPDMWATWSETNPPQQWIMYEWEQPETLTGSSVSFWGDQPAGSGTGVAPPKAWRLEYWDGVGWKSVSASSPYTAALDTHTRVDFVPVTTRCLRAVFDASTNGVSFAAVALQEWEVYSIRSRTPRRPSVTGAATANCS